MQTIHHIQYLRAAVNSEKAKGHSVALVPTMGNLHEGHLQLVRKAQQIADVVVVSIFVNPMQFGASEDWTATPRTQQEDMLKLEAENTHYLFLPEVDEVYPNGTEQHTKVSIEHLGSILCGKSRPVHFEGVCTVVNKLFNLVQPTHAVFGEKDYQQMAIIRRMTQDLCMPIDIVGVPTEREANGLAMSSRNNYLNGEQKETAGKLFGLLQQTRAAILEGNRSYEALSQQAEKTLSVAGFTPDYFEIRNAGSLAPLRDNADANEIVILVAAYLNDTRLIDNIHFSTTAE